MTRTPHVAKLAPKRSRVVPPRWIVVAAVAAATALAPVSVAVGAGERASWPMHRSDLARTGTNPIETTISPANASSLRLDWSAPGGYRSSPAVSGGIAYLSCETADVCALDASTGRLLWRTTVGQAYAPVMPVVSGGVVYVGWSRPASITALDASTGAVRWSTRIAPDGVDLKGPPLVAGGMVHQSTSDDVFHGLDAASGARRWATPITLPSSPALVGGILYVGGSIGPRTNRGAIHAVRPATGEILWQRPVPSGDRISSPVVSDGRFHVALANGYFAAPAPSAAAFGVAACHAGPCEPLWTYTSPRALSGEAAVSGGVVYQVSYDGYLHALDAATGRLLWQGATVDAGSAVGAPGPPTVANGLVFASGDDGHVYAWPTTGCTNAICPPIWVGDVGGRTQPHVSGSEVTVVDGRVFVVSSDGVLFSFSQRDGPEPPPPDLELSAVRSWGLGNVGQLGTGSTADSPVPRPVSGLAGVTKLSAGGFHTLALRQDGAGWGWGWNQLGQADGGLSNSSAPLDLSNDRDVREVSAGIYHSLLVTGEEGTVRSMGAKLPDALAAGPRLAHGGLVVVPGISGARSVAAGGLHSLALKDDGTVWAWGSNMAGQLGTGSTADSSSPARVPGLDDVVAISAGLYHSLALRDDGTVWAWGWNGLGALGTGARGGVGLRPAPVVGLSGVRSISAGGVHSLAVSLDGNVKAWGWNGVGQLGTGRTGDVAWAPAAVPITGVADVAAGGYHSMVRKADGTVWSWGWNRYGQLGTGSTADSAVPVRVPGLHDATAISSGLAHSVAAGP